MKNRCLPPLAAFTAPLPPLAGKILLMGLLFFGHALPLQAGEPQVLTARPEKIEAVLGQKIGILPLARDPFNFTHETITFQLKREGDPS